MVLNFVCSNFILIIILVIHSMVDLGKVLKQFSPVDCCLGTKKWGSTSKVSRT